MTSRYERPMSEAELADDLDRYANGAEEGGASERSVAGIREHAAQMRKEQS